MLTHFFKSINWVDVGLLALLVRIVFIGVRTGFINEFFKILGVITAVFVSFQYYASLSAWVINHSSINPDACEFILFCLLWVAAVWAWKLLREGVLILFKVETNHQGFDKYAGGVVAALRGFVLCSMTIFAILLMHQPYLNRLSFDSVAYKIDGRTATGLYTFLHHDLVSKFVEHLPYNDAADLLMSGKAK